MASKATKKRSASGKGSADDSSRNTRPKLDIDVSALRQRIAKEGFVHGKPFGLDKPTAEGLGLVHCFWYLKCDLVFGSVEDAQRHQKVRR